MTLRSWMSALVAVCALFAAVAHGSSCVPRPLNILLTNDDGFATPGIVALHEALVDAGHAVRRIAPRGNHSGGSTSLSIRPIAVERQNDARFEHVYAVDGTPATTTLLGPALFDDQAIDLIVSGINEGANLGPATPISGTVGATVAGLRLLDPAVPGIAVSTDLLNPEPAHADNLALAQRIAGFTARLVRSLQEHYCGLHPVLPPDRALNVNYPSAVTPRGVRFAHQSARSTFALAFAKGEEGTYLPQLARGAEKLADPAGDTELYSEGFITVVPIDGDYSAAELNLVLPDALAAANAVEISASSLPAAPVYPASARGATVDNYHGTAVADPYRWMESLDAPEVTEWVRAQNAVTRPWLNALPLRDHFGARLTALWDYPRTGLPALEAGQLFYARNAGLERQAPLYRRDPTTGKVSLILDPNAISADGGVSLASWRVAPDGRYLAYGLATGGADWRTLKVRDLTTGQDLPDAVEWVRFSGLAWTLDGKGFFYSRYPEPPKNKALEAVLQNHAVWYHRIGTPQSQDILIYARPDLPGWVIGADVTEDGRYLLVILAEGAGNRNRLYFADLGDPLKPALEAPVRPLVESDDAEYMPIGNVDSTLFLRTDKGAPNRKVVAIDLDDPAAVTMRTIIGERATAMESVALIGGQLIAQYLVDVQSELHRYALDGTLQGSIELPGTGTVSGLSGRTDHADIWFVFNAPLSPATVYRHDPASGVSTPFDAPAVAFDAARYQTTAHFARSKDGTRVPYFLTARKDLVRDASHSTLLYGYGGFSVSTLPTWRTDVLAWLELGGTWVTASLRGGAEYGEAWHEAGMLERKQNVFDDFIAVAEDLVETRVTRPEHLAIMGGSNGGLLVAAVMNQRPELFAAALPAVGVLDMLRFDQFTGGRLWVSEYGTATRPDQFAFLRAYSPLHNLRSDVCYPATLVTTADHDDRVVPSHSFKYTAALQAVQDCARPVLIRVETSGSHGYRPTDRLIAERADQLAFAAAATGLHKPDQAHR